MQDILNTASLPDSARVNSRKMSSIVFNTRFGYRNYTIRPESPRTNQALVELGIDRQDYHFRFFKIKN